MRVLSRSRAGRTALGALGVIVLATLVAVVMLWPSGSRGEVETAGLAGPTESGEVTLVSERPCPVGALPGDGSANGGQVCISIEVRLESGADSGDVVSVDLGTESASSPEVSVGDGVRLSAVAGPDGIGTAYTLADFDRSAPMLWLAIAFAGLVIVFGRLRGALSLLGLVISLGVVLVYIVPAIRDGEAALAVALSGSLAVMLITISLAHGFNAKSLAAMLGTTASLILVVLLASGFTELTHLTGASSEETAYLASTGSGISLQGLLLAGMVIGSLGVLDDVTVSQASTVMALRRSNSSHSAGELFRRAIEVGRDHISATVNTLVLAYVGASLPVLLIFTSGDIGFSAALNVEIVAKEVVAMLVGSIGLIAAVPLTTFLAARLAVALPDEAIDEDSSHGHAH